MAELVIAEFPWTTIVGGGAVGMVFTAIMGYLVAARRMSGKIGTSDAEQIWAEASSIRADQRVQLDRASDRSLNLEIRVAKLEERNNDLVGSNLQLRAEVEACKQLAKTLRATIAELEAKLKGAR